MNKIRRGNREGSRLFGYLMVVPATLLLVVVSIIPLLDGVYLAFTNTNLNTGADAWVGIQNFVEIFQDSKFYQVFGFTILYAFAVVLFSYILGMLIALLLNQDIRFRGVFRAIILAPWVVPPVVATITWSWLLNDKVGLINTVLQNIGHDSRTDLFSVRPDSGEGNGYRIRRLEILSVYDDHLAGGHAVHRWCAL